MRRIFLLTVSLAAMSHLTAAAADEPMIMVRSNQDQTPVPKELERSYLSGAVTALATADVFSMISENDRLFCMPLSHALTVEEFREMAETNLVGFVSPDMVIMAAIDALKDKYPCS